MKLSVTAMVTAFAAMALAQTRPGGVSPLSIGLCAPCRLVTPDQTSPSILKQPTPSFASIANRPNVTDHSLCTFLQKTHSTTNSPFRMPNPELADYQDLPRSPAFVGTAAI